MAEDLASTPPLLLRLCFFCVTLLLAYFTGPIFFLSFFFFCRSLFLVLEEFWEVVEDSRP